MKTGGGARADRRGHGGIRGRFGHRDRSGLADHRSGNRLEIATMFAALALLAVLGVAIFAALSLLEWLLLRRWHESAIGR